MLKENVLELQTIQGLFNKFFTPNQKLFQTVLPNWLAHPQATRRMFGITASRYNGLPAAGQQQAAVSAWQKMQDRFTTIFQRRHDCIHNCDRPRVSPQPLSRSKTINDVISDVEFVVHRCDAHIGTEFRAFLLALGCPGAIIGQAGY